MKSAIGLWINTGTHMGQVFWGRHGHRTSEPFKDFMYWKLSNLVDHCFRKGWEWEYVRP